MLKAAEEIIMVEEENVELKAEKWESCWKKRNHNENPKSWTDNNDYR